MADGEAESDVAFIEQGLNQAPTTEEPCPSVDPTAMTLWSVAALMETLALVGGVMWIMSGPGAIGMPGRVAIVAMAAVLGGGAIAIAAARKSR